MKKKDLNSTKSAPAIQSKYESSFKSENLLDKAVKPEAMFLPPEAFGHAMSPGDDDVMLDIQSASGWDVAIRYHEFKAKKSLSHLAKQLRKISAQAVLQRAQAVLGSVVHPTQPQVALWNDVPHDAGHIDIDIEETLENSVLSSDEVWMSFTVPSHQSVVLTVDTSLSMTGEKLALTAVALAVVLLQFPNDPIGIIAFENEAKTLKSPNEQISIQQLVERFLDVPAQGYTHLEEGLLAALKMVKKMERGRKPLSVVALTDGKYTAGRDPAYLAPRFPHLIVMKIGSERASLNLCRELAKKGHGQLTEVGDLNVLPTVMYGVVKDLLRGKSSG